MTFEEQIEKRYGADFDRCYEYLDEGNDKRDLLFMVLESFAVSDEGLEVFLKEVTDHQPTNRR